MNLDNKSPEIDLENIITIQGTPQDLYTRTPYYDRNICCEKKKRPLESAEDQYSKYICVRIVSSLDGSHNGARHRPSPPASEPAKSSLLLVGVEQLSLSGATPPTADTSTWGTRLFYRLHVICPFPF